MGSTNPTLRPSPAQSRSASVLPALRPRRSGHAPRCGSLFMKILVAILASFGLLLSGAAASDAVDAELFPAEFLYKYREKIGITEDQLKVIAGIMREAQPAFDEGKRQLEEAASALQKILREDRPNDDEADEKMRALLDCEGEIKMHQLRTLLAVRAQLKPEQLAKARELRDQLIAQAKSETSQRERVNKKLEQLRTAIRTRSESGEIGPEIIEGAKGIYEMLNAGKEAEAEKRIDDLLGKVGDAKPKP
jgi:hypothetical protein